MALVASLLAFAVEMATYDAFSFIQSTFIVFTLIALTSVFLQLPSSRAQSARVMDFAGGGLLVAGPEVAWLAPIWGWRSPRAVPDGNGFVTFQGPRIRSGRHRIWVHCPLLPDCEASLQALEALAR